VTAQVAGPFKVESKSCDLKTLAEITRRKELLRALMIWAPILTAIICLVALTLLARKRWPVITILLYTMWVTVVFMPVVFFVAMWLSGAGGPDLDDIPAFYGQFWPFWIFCAVIIISQFLLLIVPIKIVKQRPKAQRSFWVTAIAAGALFAIVVLGIAWSIAAATYGDGAIEGTAFLCASVFLIGNWLAWSRVFLAFARNTDPRSYIRRLMKWLLRGTILELLIVVPSHVIVRQKDVCCAHCVTAAGIATGLAVMLISFGPGIYFLYAERIESKKAKNRRSNTTSKCGGEKCETTGIDCNSRVDSTTPDNKRA